MAFIGVEGSAPHHISPAGRQEFLSRDRAWLPQPKEAAVMRYVVTDDFVAKHGWTPDSMARALSRPLAQIGVHVERARGFGQGGFQSDGLTPEALRQKTEEVKRVLQEVLDGPPPDK